MDEHLTEHEIEVIGKAVDSWASGPFIQDWEFPIVCPCDRTEMMYIAQLWPGNRNEEATKYAVSSALNNLLGYPHGKQAEVERRLSTKEGELRRIYAKWRRLDLNYATGKTLVPSSDESC